MAYGFKIGDFPPGRGGCTILEAVEARERHLEAHWLMKAMQTMAEIPTTFDVEMPEEAFSAQPQVQLRIGDTHLVPDETGQDVPGVLCDGSAQSARAKLLAFIALPLANTSSSAFL